VAATFHAALVEVYLAEDGLPTLWFNQAPEGTARSLPNAVLTDREDAPSYDSGGNNGYMTAAATFTFLGEHSDVETAALALIAALTPAVLTVTDKRVRLYRGRYEIVRSAQRGPDGEFLDEATVEYTAELTPS
jgi:hypothetical protein